VQLIDARGNPHTIVLAPGRSFHTHRGAVEHDRIIGAPEGSFIEGVSGAGYLALRPALDDFVLSMPRGATVIYPKDAARIVGLASLGPGDRVLEAGAGSGALTCWLLRAVGASGSVTSIERRDDFAEVARENVARWFGGTPRNWSLTVGEAADAFGSGYDAVVFDMLAPWECLPMAAGAVRPGGSLVVYVATTTQLSRVVEAIRESSNWTEPRAEESLVRTWHLDGLSVRPDHRMIGHTAFLVAARRLAPGASPPVRRRRPAPGAYGPDYAPPGEAG
jgi:tRNA (adenine57-N1/adenine58-N1)-methyltransferase